MLEPRAGPGLLKRGPLRRGRPGAPALDQSLAHGEAEETALPPGCSPEPAPPADTRPRWATRPHYRLIRIRDWRRRRAASRLLASPHRHRDGRSRPGTPPTFASWSGRIPTRQHTGPKRERSGPRMQGTRRIHHPLSVRADGPDSEAGSCHASPAAIEQDPPAAVRGVISANGRGQKCRRRPLNRVLCGSAAQLPREDGSMQGRLEQGREQKHRGRRQGLKRILPEGRHPY